MRDKSWVGQRECGCFFKKIGTTHRKNPLVRKNNVKVQIIFNIQHVFLTYRLPGGITFED